MKRAIWVIFFLSAAGSMLVSSALFGALWVTKQYQGRVVNMAPITIRSVIYRCYPLGE